jgi:hypothetical protein
MPQANHAPTTPIAAAATAGRPGCADAPPPADEASFAWPLGDIETELFGLRTAASLLGHLAASPNEVKCEDLEHIRDQIIPRHDRLDALWSAAWKEHKGEHAAHQHELDEAKKMAAPLSEAGVRRFNALRRMLRMCAEHTIDECNALDAAVSAAAGDGRA